MNMIPIGPLMIEHRLIERMIEDGRVTLVYGAKDEQFNNAVCLKEFI
jgi:uncharacterized protein YeaO (DUF488 family)